MYNSYFNLPRTDYENTYNMADIFETNKARILPDAFISDNESAFYYKIIPDNTLLEHLSYQEYNRSDYWDLLFKINQMQTPYDLPKSEDYVLNLVQQRLNLWTTKFPKLCCEVIEEKRIQFTEELLEVNEKHRNFRFVKNEYIPLMFGALANE